MKQYIVELQKGTWLAPITGDPGRTIVINNARKFQKESSAYRSLANALDKRDFDSPKVVPVEICEGCGGVLDMIKEKCLFCANECPF